MAVAIAIAFLYGGTDGTIQRRGAPSRPGTCSLRRQTCMPNGGATRLGRVG